MMLPDNGKRCKQYFNYHMTVEELKILLNYVQKICDTKFEIVILLMAFRGLRPSEALAVNILDFNKDYTRLTYREAKTNKIRENEVIVEEVAQRIATYVMMNGARLNDGYLFPYHNKKTKSKDGHEHYCPYIATLSFNDRFGKIRTKIGKEHVSFNEKHPWPYSNGKLKLVYRIHPYSLRRFFETYFYVANHYNLALLKEIMEYSSSFDPMKHYIRIVHREEQKSEIMNKTFNSLAKELIYNQKTLDAYA